MARNQSAKEFLDRVRPGDGWCGAMEELPGYVFKNYHHLLTPPENAAWSAIMQQDKALGSRERGESDQEAQHRKIAKECYAEATKDDNIRQLLDRGVSSFYASVTARILDDPANGIVLNRCPRCKALCHTPHAKQCPACFHDWH